MGNLMGGDNGSEAISDEDFNLVFKMFDIDKSGTIEKSEIVAFIKHFFNDGTQNKVVTSKPSVRGSVSNDSFSQSLRNLNDSQKIKPELDQRVP